MKSPRFQLDRDPAEKSASSVLQHLLAEHSGHWMRFETIFTASVSDLGASSTRFGKVVAITQEEAIATANGR